ncbi:MAG: DUF362 domain-containing protein [Candidatus Aenigmatarchaeota archaeon]
MRSIVAVVKTSPKTVLNDIKKAMELAEYKKFIKKDKKTILKLNLSWTLFYPACSTSPWQLEGVLKTLKESGYSNLLAVENKTVVTNAEEGAKQNKWLNVLKKYGVEFLPLYKTEWVEYKPKHELLCWGKKFVDKITIPKIFFDTNIIHLPTQKTHGHSIMTGAMKNAFGGLLKEARHHYHKHIHEILVDLLIVQKEIHHSLFAVMDGTVCGNGAGPRTMKWEIKNYVLASADMVAIDSVSSKMMGFEPFQIPKIKLAHDLGLGCGDLKQIEIVGEDISKINYNFKTKRSPVIFFDQLFRKSPIEPLLFHTWFFNFCILGSAIYHDYLWYPIIGKKRVKEFMKTEWGKVFEKY